MRPMLRPTSVHKAKSMGSKVVAYANGKPVLVFESIHLCASYLFHTLNKWEKFRVCNKIKQCHTKKLTDDTNVFAKPITYRLIVKGELIERLGEDDYIVLSEEYRNHAYEQKVDGKVSGIGGDYSLEEILDKGDLVEIKFGGNKGYTTEILEVKKKRNATTPGSKYYSLLMQNGSVGDFKANVLELVEKREFLTD